ncbi:MAG: hypothetical protein ACTSU3_00100, partial [Candidatus Thorarchaeota archaeon]
MSNLVIIYTSPHGRQEEKKFQKDDSKIELHMRAATNVDLSPLQACSNLELLDLSNNQLEIVDLGPLEENQTLLHINLGTNRIESIDLWPLWKSENLEEIDLSCNRFTKINITPIVDRACIRLDEDVKVEVDYVLRYLLSGSDTSRITLCNKSGESIE